MNLVAVIMAGGKGERFWPKSRTRCPKQFLKLFGQRTMIQHTVDRILPLMPIENVFVVTNGNYKDIVKEQLPEMPEENIIIEPVGRNTAPCIGLAAVHIKRKFADSVMLVLPSDHMILNVNAFNNVLKRAASLAHKENALVTLGIQPDKPETGYGYIKYYNNLKDGAYPVEKFVEKPDKGTAEKYLKSGEYLWNSGMFVWKTEVILENIRNFLPETYLKLVEIGESINRPSYNEILDKNFSLVESISIDYGVMEKAPNIYVYPSVFGWDDVGSWTALERVNELDENDNYISGKVINIGSSGCIIEGNSRLIAAIGLEDLIIVESEDAILICPKEQSQRVKEVLQVVKENNKELL